MFRSKLRGINQEHIYLLAIVILAAFIRLWRLNTSLPIFYDEGVLSYWGLKVYQSGYSLSDPSWIYVSVVWDRKPSFSAFLFSLSFHAFGVNLFAARFVSAVSGILSVILIWKLAKELYDSIIIGLMSSLFLSISVFHVWYSRLAMQEALLTLLIIAVILAYYMAIKYENDLFFLLGGLSIGLAINTKQNGAIAFIIVIFFLLIKSEYRYVFKKKAFWLSLVVAAVIHSPFLYWAFTHNFDIYRSPGRVDIDLTRLFSAWEIYLRIIYLASWTQDFLGWPMLVFTLLFIPILLFRRKKDDILLIIWIAVTLVSFWPAVRFYPRYLFPAIPCIYIATSRVVTTLFEEVKNFRIKRQKEIMQSLIMIFVLIIIIDTSVFLFGTLTQPSKEERLPIHVKRQFIESSSSGYGIEESIQFLRENNYTEDTVVVALPYFKWSIAFLTEDYYPVVYDIDLIDGYFENNETSKLIVENNVCVFIIKNYVEEYNKYEYNRISEIPNTHLEKIIYIDGSPEVHIFVKSK